MNQKLIAQLQVFEQHINHAEMLSVSVSQSSIGWHIDHCLLTIYQITNAIKQSKAEDYKWKFKAAKYILFTLNKIPRGKAKAPKIVTPVSFTMDEINCLSFV